MKQLYSELRSFAADETGATAIEYALIAAFVGVGMFTALTSLASVHATTYSFIGTTLTGAN